VPQYSYSCPNGHSFMVFNSVANHSPMELCTHCGTLGEQIITAPMMVKVAADVRYDSPVTGEPITSWEQRKEDLKKHNCIEYDPEMKKDQERRQKEKLDALDKSIDTTVEAAIEKMPGRQRAKLHSEVVEQGLTAEVTRQ
jgi:hypothetical protein